jgi:molybdate transport system ATP-binding protein
MPADAQQSAATLSVRVRVKPVKRGDFDLDVAFEAGPGVTILFGPSGSGKSTTLSAIAGLRLPDEGRIALGDDVWLDTQTGAARAIHERGVSLVFQAAALFPHLSARHNVEYGIDRRVPKAERRARALAMLERMKVGHLAERRPRTFSGGEAQRVALARAFAREPRVLLLDEAFSAMDRELRRELLGDVRAQVSQLAIPTIMVTHHRMEARAMGDRVLLMAAGRIHASGTPEETLRIAGEVGEMSQEDAFDVLDLTPMPILARRKP